MQLSRLAPLYSDHLSTPRALGSRGDFRGSLICTCSSFFRSPDPLANSPLFSAFSQPLWPRKRPSAIFLHSLKSPDECLWKPSPYGLHHFHCWIRSLDMLTKTVTHFNILCTYSCVLFSHSVVSDSLWPHGLQHARLPCPSPTPGAYSNSLFLVTIYI